MRRRTVFIGVLVILAVAFVAPFVWRRIEAWGVGIHHRSVAKELAGWEEEYGRVQTLSEAKQAAGMLGYVQRYYVTGPGYRSDAATEAALAAQRSRTAQAIATALEDFTGQHFGEDPDRWLEWIEKAGSIDSKPPGAAEARE
ncbi:MAG: hypothetical protein BGO49_26490 [Planctomycetales bacterium 71-10]|nr:MAG: hypothetical protein BGO49_26490 [Planctomycetales bacterium 71-10]